MNDSTTHTPKICECGCGQPVRKPTHRFLQGHNSKAKGLTPEERFWQFVKRGAFTDCWEWTGALRNGYGVMNIEYKVVYAHRFSYELHYGPLKEGMNALHRCDNRKCCNPYHLFDGTQGDNNRDMYAKGRANNTHNTGAPKLTAEQVRQIRNLAAQGARYPALAEQFGVSIPAISLVVTRKRWKHV